MKRDKYLGYNDIIFTNLEIILKWKNCWKSLAHNFIYLLLLYIFLNSKKKSLNIFTLNSSLLIFDFFHDLTEYLTN